MKIRTIYFKVKDMEKALAFWKNFLNVPPVKLSAEWSEFKIGEVNLAFLIPSAEDHFKGSNCVIVFEYSDIEMNYYIDKATSLGAKVILNGLNDPEMRSMVLEDPEGNEFEISKLHT